MRRGVLLAAGATVAAMTLMPVAAQAAQGSPANGGGRSDARTTAGDYNHGKSLAVSKSASEKVVGQPPLGPSKVGSVRTWLGLNDYLGYIYLKNYTLRGVGNHIEVWVANDRAFPSGDCRNTLGLTNVTDTQVSTFIHEFDTTILPTESANFSVAPDRNGHNAVLPKLIPNLPSSEYKGEGDNTVVLVDNVRDANYYVPTTPDGQTYIAGFFYSVFNEYFDRNAMTIDVYDWLHRTGANPPDDRAQADYAACTAELRASRPVGMARPHLYEGTFAHEYQHLLEYYASPGEVSWINEGLSDYAQTLVGYVDPSVPVTDPSADSHLACFSGFTAAQGLGGPENSLTQWGDQGGPETLCDYGAAYSFLQYLVGHYGAGIATALHNETLDGIPGLQAVLPTGVNAMDVIHRWAAMWALDTPLDTASLTGGDAALYSEASLGAQINWDATYGDINHDGTLDDPGNEAYSTPGAPPNGSDYVRLGNGSAYVGAGGLTSLTFTGDNTLEPDPVLWTVDNGKFYSGSGPNFDRAIIKTVAVPSSGDQSLVFDTTWNTELGWDFGFVQVSTDGGATWTSLANADTTTAHDPGAIPAVVSNLPGFTGDSGGQRSETFSLSAYAGQNVLLSFRYITDSGVDLPGWWVDNVRVGGTLVADGTDLTGWQSMSQVSPYAVAGFTVQLVGYTPSGTQAWYFDLPITHDGTGFHGALNQTQLNAALGTSATVVAALVMQDDPTESAPKYALYSLVVNGVTQPGGGAGSS